MNPAIKLLLKIYFYALRPVKGTTLTKEASSSVNGDCHRDLQLDNVQSEKLWTTQS